MTTRAVPIRLGAALGITLLHLAVYDAVNALNAARPVVDLHDFSSRFDAWIPYLEWTAYVYYLGDVWIIVGGVVILWTLPRHLLGRTVLAYVGMILVGGAVQAMLPAQAPYPDDPHWLQRTIHDALDGRLFACLPSMHVALAVLPALLVPHALDSRAVFALYVLGAVMVSVATVTAKEHYFLDAVAGALLATVIYGLWLRGTASPAGIHGGG